MEIKKIQDKLISAFKSKDTENIIENLFYMIKFYFYNQIKLIRNLLKYENELEIIDEIIVYFFSKKFEAIKTKFNPNHLTDYQYFIRTIYLAIKHSIQDILSRDEEYSIKQRLRKEIINIINSSDYLSLTKKGKIYFVIKKSEIKNSLKIKPKPENIFGISLNDIEKLIFVVLDKNPMMLNSLVDKCYNYLIRNGYIRLNVKEEYEDGKILNNYPSLSEIDLTTEKIVNEFINACTEYQLKIFYYHFIKDMPLNIIANKLKLSPQLVNYYKKRSVQYLKKILIKYDFSEEDKEIISLITEKLNNRINYE